MMQYTQTRTATSTMTVARVRNVMVEVGADFYGLVPAGLATYSSVSSWVEDLTYILENEAASGFQIQLRCAGEQIRAIDYVVSSDGSIRGAMAGGGIDYMNLPAGTVAMLFVSIDNNSQSAAAVLAHLAIRGWGTNGVRVQGSPLQDRSYSSQGYGVRRGLIGQF